LNAERVTGLLLDVEGTTTPIDFVYKTLFPYALSHAAPFLQRHGSTPDVRAALDALRQENLADVQQGLDPPLFGNGKEDAESRSAVAYMEWLTARDRKSQAFKSLQGKIWKDGYDSGQLQAEVFADVPGAFSRWVQHGKKICIFSSGSVLAQKLLFSHSMAGDLTKYICSYFDTSTGAKADSASYKKIAHDSQLEPHQILFISDVTIELDAARSANLNTLLCMRPGNRPQPPNTHAVIRNFDEVLP